MSLFLSFSTPRILLLRRLDFTDFVLLVEYDPHVHDSKHVIRIAICRHILLPSQTDVHTAKKRLHPAQTVAASTRLIG